MYFPQYADTAKARDMMTAFGGYNEKLSCADGEWSGMTNMTSDHYPVMSPRGKRGYTTHYGNRPKIDLFGGGEMYPVSLLERNGLSVIRANENVADSSYTIIFDKDSYTYNEDGSVLSMNGPTLPSEYCEVGKRYDVVKMGARDVFIGANIAYNRETDQKEYIYSSKEVTLFDIGIANGNKEVIPEKEFTGKTLDELNTSAATDETYKGEYDGQIATLRGASYGSETPSDYDGVYLKWSETQKEWYEYKSLYAYLDINFGNDATSNYTKSYMGSEIKLIFDNSDGRIPDVTTYFPTSEGDGKYSVTTTCTYVENEEKYRKGLIIKLSTHVSTYYNLKNYASDAYPLTIEFTRKEMLYGTECNNRIWACSTDGHEIYASALGEWSVMCRYSGISTDSYAVTIGSDGEFTGAVTYNGNPIFFKEKSMIRIAVSSSGAHQVKEIPCPGVQKGSRHSICVINNILYYKGVEGIYAYDGSMPVLVSPSLTKRYFNAEAGALLDKYYISMADSEGKYHMFVFDTTKGLWMREDNTHAISFCSAEDDLFFIELPQKEIRSVRGTVLPDGTGKPYVYEAYGKDNNDWEVTSGVVGFASPDHKYIGKLSIRLSLALGSNVDFYIEYDSSGVWEHKFSMAGRGTRSYTIPVIPHRCDHFKYKIVGKGECKIFSISKTIEEGSDV